MTHRSANCSPQRSRPEPSARMLPTIASPSPGDYKSLAFNSGLLPLHIATPVRSLLSYASPLRAPWRAEGENGHGYEHSATSGRSIGGGIWIRDSTERLRHGDRGSTRAMYGTTAWSDAWQGTCSDLDPVVGPKLPGYEHLTNDCAQYEVAQQMRYRQPEVATNQQR